MHSQVPHKRRFTKTVKAGGHAHLLRRDSLETPRSSARARAAAVLSLLLLPMGACVIPMDTSANAVEIAMEQLDYTLGAMRDENAMLQRQLDSLSRELKKTDSLLRSIANLTGNPIIDPPTYIIPPRP